MVKLLLPFPQIIFQVLGITAILIFVLKKVFNVSNQIMALISMVSFFGTFLLVLIVSQTTQVSTFISQWPVLGSLLNFETDSFYIQDPGANLLILLALGLGALVSIYSAEYLKADQRQSVYYALLILMICGFTGMLYASNLMVIYLFSELMGISTYALVAFRRHTDTAIEAGFKYLIMGSVASVIILLGFTYVFFSMGTINSIEIINNSGRIPIIAALLIFSGFSLKSALVPLHTWLPDAHGRAPSSISAILSGVMVQGAFYTMVRLILALGFDAYILGTILLVLSLLSILIGNLLGLVQEHTKRLLGYSTISQVGYIALCVAIGLRNNSSAALQAGFIIIFVHAITKSLAFLSKGVFHHYMDISKITDLDRSTELSVRISIYFGLALVSLSAIPPLPGFTGKWIALSSIISSGDGFALLCLIVFLSGSIIALGYYFPILVKLFKNFNNPQKNKDRHKRKCISWWMEIPLAILALIIIFVSISPQSVIRTSERAAIFMSGLIR